jgi:repressor LexA
MMPKPLSELEQRVLAYIVEYLRSNTYQPSVREIGREFTIKSTKTVSELLQSLANKGWIERDPSRSRGVRLLGLERHPGTTSIPVLRGNDGVEGLEYFEIDRRFVGSPGAFLVPMPGDHLLEQGIRTGDLLLVEPADVAGIDSGDIVAVRQGDGMAIRRVAQGDGGVLLEPDGVASTPLRLDTTQARTALQGRVVGVVRRLRPVPVHATVSVEPTAV